MELHHCMTNQSVHFNLTKLSAGGDFENRTRVISLLTKRNTTILNPRGNIRNCTETSCMPYKYSSIDTMSPWRLAESNR